MTKQQYVQIFRRRRDGKTDYRKRRGIIQGRKPFLTVRVSNNYVYGQIVRAAPQGDITLCSTSSRNLAKRYGWKGSAKNIPSAYLTGYLLGKTAQSKKISETGVYSGVSRFVHGSRMAAFLGGVKDSGLGLEFDEKILPDEKRKNGSHISDYAKKLTQEDSPKYNAVFSKSLSKGFKPEDYPSLFDRVKDSIESKPAPKK
jgi:large subunit ribosomal protein L18